MLKFRVSATHWIGPYRHIGGINEIKGVLGPNSEDIDRGGPIANILVIVHLTVLGPNRKIEIPVVVQINPCGASEDLNTSICC